MNRGITMMRSLIFSNLRSRNCSTLPKEAIIYLNRETIVCWHPEQPFPYKYSKPLPKEIVPKSMLQIGKQEVIEAYDRKPRFQIADELAQLTQTTKHRWFPRARNKKAKKTPRERKYM